MSQPVLTVRLLGEPEVESSAGRHAFRSDKRYLLLAYLAVHRDWVERARLARLFWPDHDAAAARHNLRQLIKRLDSLPWSPDVESSSGREGARLRWRPPADLVDLDAALVGGRWDEARALHRGALLVGVVADAVPSFDAWLVDQRSQVEERVRTAFMQHGAALVVAGKHATAAELFGHLVAAEPFDEEALQAYMEATAAAGQPTKAMGAFDAFAARVREEFGLNPTSTTAALADQVRAGGVHGGRSLRDEGRSVLAGAGGQPVSDRTGGPTVQPGWLLGRDLELSDVHRLLSDPHCRLLTITGPGGVGKSALARHAAHELSGTYADGCVYVALDGVGGSSGLLAAIAAHVARPLGSQAQVDPATAIGTRRMALVLDDLDGLHEEAERLPDLLDRCPNLSIVTTARERLSVAGEWLLPLDGLPVPAAGASLPDVLANDAVRLFVAHAQRLRPDYYLTDSDARDVARICRSVSGLPLAVELAAAWTRVLPVAAIADEIATGLELLAGGPRGAADRHTSMRACIERSWQNVSEAERVAWRALALFESPFDRAAAARVTGVALPQLAALVDASVLRSSPEGRFSFHPLLRAYGVERLADTPRSTEPEGARSSPPGTRSRSVLEEAHATYFLASVVEALDVAGPTGRAMIEGVAASLDDVATAWRWAVAAASGAIEASRPPDTAALCRWCSALAAICERRAWYALAVDLFEEARLSFEGEALPDELLGTVMAQLSWHRLRLGRAEAAESGAVAALELLDDHRTLAPWRTAVLTRGGVALQEGRYAAAEAYYEVALESATVAARSATASGRREIAAITGSLGVAKQFSGDREGAALQFRNQLEVVSDLGDPVTAISPLSNLGNVLRILGRLDEAKAALEEGLRLAVDEHYDTILPALNINLGVLHRQLGESAVARRHFEAAAKLARECGRLPLEVLASFQLGRLELDSGSAAAAREHFDAACTVAVGSGNLSATLDALAGFAWVEWREGARRRSLTLARVVHSHPATTPGSRTWASELLALIEEPSAGADLDPGQVAMGDSVTRALSLIHASGRE